MNKMKKYQLYFALAFASMLWVNVAQAQFNYGAKKKPAAAAKDTVLPKTDITPAAPGVPAAPSGGESKCEIGENL
jgi:hypothetical protein